MPRRRKTPFCLINAYRNRLFGSAQRPDSNASGRGEFDLIAQGYASRAGAKYLKFHILRISKSKAARGFKILKIPRSARRFDKFGLCPSA